MTNRTGYDIKLTRYQSKAGLRMRKLIYLFYRLINYLDIFSYWRLKLNIHEVPKEKKGMLTSLLYWRKGIRGKSIRTMSSCSFWSS